MVTANVKSIRSLARGLDVLRLLQRSGALSLADLHRLSGLPKATLLRVLKTLIEEGAAWQRMADGAYIASYSLSALAQGIDRETELVEAASPVLDRLSREVSWPSVLAVPRLAHMEVVETNASRTRIAEVPLGPVGFQINMARSASGRAYLAACDEAVREATLDRLRLSPRRGDRVVHLPGYVDRMLAETRANGFGLRDPDFGGDFDRGRGEADDARDSLAVAIRVGAEVPGVSLTDPPPSRPFPGR
jgi:IclR family mhp operon transcriptional activator